MALTYDQINAITTKKYIPKMYDNIFNSNPMLKRMEEKKQLQDGGTSMIVPLNYAMNSSGGWYAGADTLATTDNEVISAAEYNWKQIYENITIQRSDEIKNSGDAAKLNFVQSKIKIAEKTIADRLGTGLFNAGTDSKAIAGLRQMLSTSNTVGGISQSTYSFWQSNVDSITTTITLPAIQSMDGLCTIGNDRPTVRACTQTMYDKIWALLQPQQRFMNEKDANAGFTSLMINGIPLVVDSHAVSGYLWFLNEDYLVFGPQKEEWMRFEPFAKPISQNVKVAKIYCMLAFGSSNNRMHGVMSAITA